MFIHELQMTYRLTFLSQGMVASGVGVDPQVAVLSQQVHTQGVKRLTIAVTGASGSIYAARLVECAAKYFERIYLVGTNAAGLVMQTELGDKHFLSQALAEKKIPDHLKNVLRVFDHQDLYAPIASGSSAPDAMVVVPCSMGTLARIANGMSSNLLERAFDVMLKQQRKTIIVPRESPLNQIHLSHLLRLSQMGTGIVVPAPGFYQRPKTIEDMVDFVVGRILELLGNSDHGLYQAWNTRLK